MGWREEDERRFISADKAAGMADSGDYVAFTMGEKPSLAVALAARREELGNVSVSRSSRLNSMEYSAEEPSRGVP